MSRFEEVSRASGKPSFAADLIYLLKHNRKWWMLPIFLALLILGTVMFLGSTAAAPFIYTLF